MKFKYVGFGAWACACGWVFCFIWVFGVFYDGLIPGVAACFSVDVCVLSIAEYPVQFTKFSRGFVLVRTRISYHLMLAAVGTIGVSTVPHAHRAPVMLLSSIRLQLHEVHALVVYCFPWTFSAAFLTYSLFVISPALYECPPCFQHNQSSIVPIMRVRT